MTSNGAVGTRRSNVMSYMILYCRRDVSPLQLGAGLTCRYRTGVWVSSHRLGPMMALMRHIA